MTGEMPRDAATAVAALSCRIQEIEAQRVLKNRADRSQLATESATIQESVDAVLFGCFGVSTAEGRYITERLKEML